MKLFEKKHGYSMSKAKKRKSADDELSEASVSPFFTSIILPILYTTV